MNEIKRTELKKHVGAVHSSNNLTLIQRKMSNVLLANAYNILLDKDLCQAIGYNSKDTLSIKKSLEDLLAINIEWNLLDVHSGGTSDNSWSACPIVEYLKIEEGLCRYSFRQELKSLLYNPEVYAKLNISMQKKFKSSYSLALYENCIRYRKTGKTPKIDIIVYRKLMGICDGKYNTFRDLNKRVLQVSLNEVNQKSDICVDVELTRQQRKVTGLQFKIRSNETQVLQIESEELPNNNLYDLSNKLSETYGCSKKQINAIFKSYDESIILNKIELIEASHSYKTGKIINLAKYLIRALEDDFQPAKTSKDVITQKVISKRSDDSRKKHEQLVKNKFEEFHADEIIRNYRTLTPGEQNLIENDFCEKANPRTVKRYYEQGLNHPGSRRDFAGFIEKYKYRYQFALSNLTPFSDFAEDYENIVL